MTSKTIVFTEEDLKEIEESQALFTNRHRDEMDGRLKDVLDVIKNRKFTTYDIMVNKIGITRRSARNFMEALRDRGFIDKQYAFIKCIDGCRRKTALYYVVEKKENGQKRKNK